MRCFSLIVIVICLAACKHSSESYKANERSSEIIGYLKQHFHIDPDTSRMDPLFKKRMREDHKSLQRDSLIKMRLSITEYAPLQLSFIRFDNYYSVIDTSHEKEFMVYLIQDIKSNKFFKDYVYSMRGCDLLMCMWAGLDMKFSGKEWQPSVSKENINAYNSINSSFTYGEDEMRLQNKKQGMQEYLNEAFRSDTLPKQGLDSLFLHYDHDLYFRQDTILKNRLELFDFLRIQAARIRSEPDYGTKGTELSYLKKRISLLLLQTDETNLHSYFWIYKNDRQLRVRRLFISGNKTSGFSYDLAENEICF